MRIVLGWVGAVVLLAGVLIGGVLVANATVFSASGFVRDYLGALAEGRVDEVLALPGVDVAGLDDRLLDPRAFTGVAAEVVSDEVRGQVHHVRVRVTGQTQGETVLEVTRVGTRFALFPEWGFAASPVTRLTVTPSGDARFTAGSLPVESWGGTPVTFAALTPALYTFGHSSRFLTADPVTVLARGGSADVALDIRPSDAFVRAVQAAVEADLTGCASQRILFPTGCPFGYAIENRVVSEPRWTIVEMPDATVAPSDRIGTWAVPGAEGVAHLSVEVQSLFDGSVSTLEEDVPFSAAYRIAFDGDAVVLAPALR
ncbi:MAG: hypothetical protein J0H23_05770 [Micrococcales bacterium]|nr:hypothetical protein [Micrococcales bacterium]OJX67791.1 MAG: hypothetical protein BGO94_02965 [Micrococcales bacterium 72-143]